MKRVLAFLGLLSFLAMFQASAAPFIQSFSPKYGASNDPSPIIITGSGFYPGTLIVRFNGVTDPTAAATSADGSTIQARVPIGAPIGSGPIFVSVNGSAHQSAEDFTVIGPGPYVAGFTPTVGTVGTPVTITGAHFFSGGQNGTLQVRFAGSGVVNAQSADGTTIVINAPAGVTSGSITVSNAKGTNVSTGFFSVPPSVSGFSPVVGRSGTNVLITGANFLGTTNVQFNDINVTDFTVLSNSAIRATVPTGATTGRVRVRAPAGSVLTTSNFVVEPLISGFTPPFGPVGTSVTVFGANLNAGPAVVRFNGVQAAAPTGVTFGQMTAVVPPAATTGPITITTSNGMATSSAKFYLPAIITSVDPIFGSQVVTIAGTNFTDASAVKFNGTDAASFSVHNDNSIGAVVPFSATSGHITVTTPAGTASNSAVKFYLPPSISAFVPTHGLPGTNVTLFGQNFLDATAVLFSGTNAPFTVVNNTTINTVVPTNALTGPITVIAPAGTNTSPVDFVLDYAANMVVSVGDSPDPVVVTSNVTYSIIVSNGGPFAAPGVTLTDSVVGPAIVRSATTTQGTLNTNSFPITGDLGSINVGDSVIVTLAVTAQSPGMITNVATVASLYPDPIPGNNSVTNTTYVQPLPLLSIRRFGVDQIRINWPAALTNYGLEFKPALEPTPPWSNIATVPIIVGSEYQLTETNSEAMRYYRLRRAP